MYCSFRFIYLALLAIASSGLSLAEDNQRVLKLFGKIDSAMVGLLEEMPEDVETVLISSSGGLPSSAAELIGLVAENELNIEIGEVCVSACAEYILPFAQGDGRTLHLKNSPFIGFHWNARIIQETVIAQISTDISNCPFRDAQELRALHLNSNVNPDFWKETLKRLGQNYSLVRLDQNACPVVKMQFENTIWLPTSEELKSFYWLEFTGKVCADDFDTCAQQIDDNFHSGIRFVIGDKLHVSN